ncbi:MAG: AarF/ABC1/UbiB kinase family protein [Firmicutes bacterium]|nr:AarF/ABC1/UbiB kinase family protein [Bacillota bacterium]
MKYKNMKRYREISRTLAKYGFSIISDKLDSGNFFKKHFLKRSTDLSKKYSRGKRVRLALEELGPTFIKLGQLLSTRYDILPADIVDELTMLQDNVGEFPYEKARVIFKSEIGFEIEEIFKEFNKKPIAAASIGQVYRGVLKSGENVVIKIQRPNIENIISRDLSILKTISGLIEDLKKKRLINYKDVVSEFSYLINKELDYTYEGQNCENFRVKFLNDERIEIPKVYWKYTTKKILMTKEIKGIKLSNIKEIEKNGYNKENLAYIGAKLFMEQIFLHGYFHGDPHPGNLFVINKGKIGFIDFGIVGYLDKETLNFITNLLRSGVNKDASRIISSLNKMNAIPDETDETLLKRDLNYILNYYYNIPFDKLNFTDALNDLLQITYEYGVKIPSQLILLIKSVMTIEGTGRKLNPNFNLTQISKELLNSIKKDKLKPKNFLKEFSELSFDNYEEFKEMPKLLKRILFKIEKGKLNLIMKQEGFKQLEKEISSMTNKVSLSLIISSLIVGSSIVIQSKTGPTLLGMSAFGLIGFSTAGILGLFLVISILYTLINKRK